MANLNKVMLMGNITRDLQLSFLPSQTPVCEFGLAVNRTWTGQDGVKKEEVTFVDCTCFGKTAEILSKYKKKGDPLFVEGRLKLDQWEAQDGSKRSKMRVVVENFQFLNRGQGLGQGGGGGAAGAPMPEDDTGGNYAPQQPQPYQQPAPQARQPYRAAGRPAAAAPHSPAQAPRAAQQPQQQPAPEPNYDADGPSQDDGPPMGSEDIPF